MEAARTVKDVSPHEFVKAYASHLKRSGKELAPYDPDWYYTRAASIARHIYLRQGLGVGALQRIYGGRKRNGSRPPHFSKSSGSVARHILQQLQQVGIIDIDTKGICNYRLRWREFVTKASTFSVLIYIFYFSNNVRGRRITSQGQRDLDQVAGRVVVAL
ncbi:unnamed protein product [Spirodela intermedia]|uniref:Uncharacterized protein n=1 Tax=Spirodela intermedia TaxID=51605 RepID=A0A7I8JCA1_SPIIN|nr:unnamed protein product [Spirodela intermedia]CAA6667365.1 unnamed protein product [Spirodela intermedia]